VYVWVLGCPIKSGNDSSEAGNDGGESGGGNGVIIRLVRMIQRVCAGAGLPDQVGQ